MKTYRTFHPLQLEDGFEFKDGDIASYGGIEEVVKIMKRDTHFPVALGNRAIFTMNGRQNLSHTEPTLILIERPKKMVEKTIEKWASDAAIKHLDQGLSYCAIGLDCLENSIYKRKIKITYEVEE